MGQPIKKANASYGVHSHFAFQNIVSYHKIPRCNYSILDGESKNDFYLLISDKEKGILKKEFQIIKKGNDFYYKNGGDILFSTLDDLITYMINQYLL